MIHQPTRIEFDPANADHRDAVRVFMTSGKWTATAPRFTHDPKFISVAHQVQAKLLMWYLENEKCKQVMIKRPAMRPLDAIPNKNLNETAPYLRRVLG